MIKFFSRTILYLGILFLIIFSYLSIIGIETKTFNTQIKKNLKNINKDLDTNLSTVKIIIDPFKFQVNIKTLGPELIFKNEKIQLESIKSKIPILSLIKKEFSSTNLTISTKSIQMNDLISFVRAYDNKIQYYLLEQIVKNGFIIADVNLNFDENGTIKNDFSINGVVKDGKLNFINTQELDKLNFIFNIKNGIATLADLNLVLGKIKFFSDKISLKKNKKEYLVEGNINNNEIQLLNDDLEEFLKIFGQDKLIDKISFKSKNTFSFIIGKKFKVKDLNLTSSLDVSELEKQNNFELQNLLLNMNDKITLSNHKIDIDYKQDNLFIKGKGFLSIQKELDEIEYEIKKIKDDYTFKSNLNLTKNKLNIDFLNYTKEINSKASLILEGKFLKDKELFFEKMSLLNEKNIMKIEKIYLDKDFNFLKIKSLDLDFTDNENFRNKVSLKRVKRNYELKGSIFNASNIIDELLKNDNQKSNFIKDNFRILIDLKKVYLDNDHFINDLNGFLEIFENEIVEAELNSYFKNEKKLTFSVKKIDDKKVTTFFSGKAKPIVKRYNFIKGYEEGTLDFYSISSKNISNSKLKIYDFKLKELPALTKLLTLASLQGIADLLSGEGIRFNEFEMNFTNNKDLMTIDEIYAIGPAISILMEGYVEKNKLVSLRGTLVPATTINKAIGSIPLLGDILVGKKTGEGVFGVSFKIKGPPKNLETTVNPIKTLTPRFITRTLEKIKKN